MRLHRYFSRHRCVLLAAAAIASTNPTDAGAVAITRGPYLQLQTTNSIVVRWRTDKPVVGQVFFGEKLEMLDRKEVELGKHTEHIVQVTGLAPSTKYFYTVGERKGTNGLIQLTVAKERYFMTPPAVGRPHPTRVWVVGDSGTANRKVARVRDAFLTVNGQQPIDAWLMLGDNAYDNGTDVEYQKAVFDVFAPVLANTVLWPTLGNHDGGSASSATQSGVYYDIFTLPTRGQAGGTMSGSEAYYSFDLANAHFVCLDSYDSDRRPGGAMLTWLEQDLAATKQDWIIAYFHHPPYTKGSHDSDDRKDSDGRMHEMREMVLPVLEAGGADLVLSGHSHSYERSYLIDGHYGGSKSLQPFMIKSSSDGREPGGGAYLKPATHAGHDGTVYTVAGSSGQTSGGKLNHPVMFLSLNELGSMVLDVVGLRLDVAFIDDRGRRRDNFSIKKEAR